MAKREDACLPFAARGAREQVICATLASPASAMIVVVTMSSEEVCQVPQSEVKSALDLKKEIELIEGTPVTQQRLVVKGSTLEDDAILGDPSTETPIVVTLVRTSPSKRVVIKNGDSVHKLGLKEGELESIIYPTFEWIMTEVANGVYTFQAVDGWPQGDAAGKFIGVLSGRECEDPEASKLVLTEHAETWAVEKGEHDWKCGNIAIPFSMQIRSATRTTAEGKGLYLSQKWTSDGDVEFYRLLPEGAYGLQRFFIAYAEEVENRRTWNNDAGDPPFKSALDF